MVKHSTDHNWANFEGSGTSTLSSQVDRKTASNKGRPKSDASSTSKWMKAPIDSEDLLPLAPPGFIESPRCGSAASRTRFTTDVPVKSARRPETISTFSKKKITGHVHATEKMEQSTRTVSTSTADSNSDCERIRQKVVLGPPQALLVPKHFFEENSNLSRRNSNLAASKAHASAKFSASSHHNSFNAGITDQDHSTDFRNPIETFRGRSSAREKSGSTRELANEKVTTKSRGRSTSRAKVPPPIAVVRTRSRSSSQARIANNTEGGITPRSRASSRSRYPPTTPNSYSKNRHRSRSTSLPRLSNDLPVRSASPAKRPHRRPPSTYRTRQELRDATLVVNGGRATASEGDANSVRSSTGWNSGPEPGSTGELTSSSMALLRNNKVGLRERLFGNEVEGSASNRFNMGTIGSEIRPRVLLAATVYHNKATNFWVATINTNQRGVAKNPERANKYLKAFSFATEQEARESAIVNAPPKMIPFNESPTCFCCKGKFAVFRRAGHCRNCGVCVCNSCSVTWPAKLIPETYNLKTEANVKVCRSCNTLSLAFKRSLLHGDYDEAVALYRTGNVNLRTPFPLANKKDESMYPIHCAAEGGNIQILRWLIDDHFCPIKVHMASKKSANTGIASMADSPIRTSKGRTVLSIAVESLKVDMMRYLVVELGISIYECKDLRPALSALEAALSALPCTMVNRIEVPHTVPTGVARWDNATFDDDCSEPSSLGVDDEVKYIDETKSRASSSRNGGGGDQGGQQICVICFDRKIDCVGTPCGHAVSCLECSGSLKLCPICNERSNFIKIYRP